MSTVMFLSAAGLALLLTGCFGGGSKERKGALTATKSDVTPVRKHAHSTLSPGDSRDLVGVKFAEGSDVRLRGNHLVSLSSGRITDIDDVLARFPGTTISRVFESASEEQLAASRKEARARSGREQADLNLFFRLRTTPGTDTVALVNALNALDIVESAAPEPKPAPPPVTPSFASGQGYRAAAASGGIDADYAQTLTGGKGENVAVVDVEYSWNRSHEDLAKARLAGSAIANGTPCADDHDHGTAVLGELTGDPNGFGVTGLVTGAALHTVNASRVFASGACGWDLANAINVAAHNPSAGDVLLLEQQWPGPNVTTDPKSQFGDVPVEWDQTGAVWTAIQNATSRGRIVIEPAGNGSQNLDDPVYNASSGKNWFSYDSGAIMVGAGNAPGCTRGSDPTIARGRLSFSDFGSRVDVQGWGDCVWTTGYGDLQGGTDSNLWYTKQFAGTSSASPIVAASAVVLSSVAKSRGTTLTPATVRSLLKSTGQPQTFGLQGHIGPLPNLRAALDALGPKLTESGHLVVDGANLGATTVPVRESWSVSGSAPAAQYEAWLGTDGGTLVKQTLSSPTSPSAVFQLERNHNYQFAARAADAAGIWGDRVSGASFNLGEYQENYSGTNPAYAGTWTRSAWQPASDGYITVSGTAGNKVTFSFTGNNVAWIATKSSNRGQADVSIDGSLVKTVDLYSATTTSAQFIAYSRSWSASGSHAIEVSVRSTAGHPKADVDAFARLR